MRVRLRDSAPTRETWGGRRERPLPGNLGWATGVTWGGRGRVAAPGGEQLESQEGVGVLLSSYLLLSSLELGDTKVYEP